MTDIVSVKFKNHGKSYSFDPGELQLAEGQQVVVETSKGLELAVCAGAAHSVPDESVVKPLRPVVRAATDSDLRVAAINKARESEAMDICQRKIGEHGLDMKLVDVECSFEGNKITFYFTSEGRVDFRELVKDLAGVFRNRIELRQIGVRDEAKMLGGIGICGRPYCCSQFLDDFQPVSTKMAKIQSMSLNPSKISGSCGRLMCCLRYEQEAYEDLVREVPKAGTFVETPAGYGAVAQASLLRRMVKVKLDGEGEDVFKSYAVDEIAVVPGGRPKPGEPLPELLKYRPKPVRQEESAEEPDLWQAPVLIAGEEVRFVRDDQRIKKSEEQSAPRQKNNRRGGRGRKNKEDEPRPAEKREGEGQRPKPPAQGQKPRHQQGQKPAPKPQPDQEQQAKSPKKHGNNYRRRRSGGGKPRPEGGKAEQSD